MQLIGMTSEDEVAGTEKAIWEKYASAQSVSTFETANSES